MLQVESKSIVSSKKYPLTQPHCRDRKKREFHVMLDLYACVRGHLDVFGSSGFICFHFEKTIDGTRFIMIWDKDRCADYAFALPYMIVELHGRRLAYGQDDGSSAVEFSTTTSTCFET